MWVCPGCGRSFARKNQAHYCGKAPETVAEYIQRCDENARAHLTRLDAIIRACCPCEAGIAWSMPSYKSMGKSTGAGGAVQFALSKARISFYVGEEVLHAFEAELDGYAHKKAALYLPLDAPLPEALLARLARAALLQEE